MTTISEIGCMDQAPLTPALVKARWTRVDPVRARAVSDEMDRRRQWVKEIVDNWIAATDLYQCDSCGQEVPSSQIKTGMAAVGVEGDFCARCRGAVEYIVQWDDDDGELRGCTVSDLDTAQAYARKYRDCWIVRTDGLMVADYRREREQDHPPELWPGQPMPPAAPTAAESANPVPYPTRPIIRADTGKVP